MLLMSVSAACLLPEKTGIGRCWGGKSADIDAGSTLALTLMRL